MKRFPTFMLCLGAAAITLPALTAQTLDPLFGQCAAGSTATLREPLVIEGIVVSDYRSKNMELNPNIDSWTVDLTLSERTAYVMAPDAGRGIRIVFNEPGENRLARYDRVKINLEGCTLSRSAEPDCMTVSGVSALNIVEANPGTPENVPRKEKSIAELTDRDIYTLVTLRDAEFVFKEGSYTNIWEPYAQRTKELHQKYEINNRMDCWPSMVRDSRGGAIYMLVNTLCVWRRTGRPVPQGVGPLTGIVVHTPMRRYGDDMGRYSIRPLDEEDIGIARKKGSSYTRLTGWLLDGSNGASLEFELLGHQTGLNKEGAKSGDRIANDTGKTKAYLWTDSGAFTYGNGDYNAPNTANKGLVANGAIVFSAPTVNWYKWDNTGRMVGSNAFYVEFPTRKITGEVIFVSMELGAGNQNGDFSWNFPLEWKAEYALDDGPYVPLTDAVTGRGIFVMRSLPWWDKVIEGSGHDKRLQTPYDAGMGLQQRTFALPASAFGRDKVTVRISPASGLLSQIRSNPAADVKMQEKSVTPKCRQTSIIRFGTIAVDYK